MKINLKSKHKIITGLVILVFITSFLTYNSSEKEIYEDLNVPNKISNPESAERTYLDLAEESTLSLSLVKMKEITLIESATVVQYSFEAQSSGGAGATCEIRMNDGSQFDMIGGQITSGFIVEGEETGSFPVGTRFSLWLRSWDGVNPAYCRDFNITTFSIPDDFTISTAEPICYDAGCLITWSEVTGAVFYQLQESNTADGTYSDLGGITSNTQYFLTSYSPQTKFYKIKALGIDGNSTSNYLEISWREPDSFTIATTESVCYDGISRITWSPVTGAFNYQLLESSTSDGTYSNLGSWTTELFADITKGYFTTQYYKVKAINDVGTTISTNYLEINWTAPDTPTISTPSQIIHTDEISIVWSDTVTGASEVNLQRSLNGVIFTDISGATSSPTLETGLNEDVYYYRVRASNGIGPVYSLEIDITVEAPDSFTIATTENVCYDGTSRITWSIVTGASSYQLQESTTFDGTYSDSGSSTTDLYVDITKSTPQTLYYKVKAINPVGETLSTNYLEINWTVPDTPTISTPNQTIYVDEISIVWSDTVTGASEVNLQRSLDGVIYTDISGATSNPTLETGLNEDVYYYRVRATNDIDSVYSQEIEINVTTPDSFTIATSESVCYDGTSRIAWSIVTGASSYQLQESTTFDGEYSDLGSSITELYADITKSSTQTLYYKVEAINPVGETLSTNYLEIYWAVPDTPIISTPNQTIYTNEISIEWSDIVTGADEVYLQRSTDSITYTNISGAISSPTLETGLNESIYYYRVEAINPINSVYSEICTINVSIQPEISEEEDVEYEFGTPVYFIEWSVNDSHPYQYQFFIDEIGQTIEDWTFETELNIDVGNFDLGIYNITLWIIDTLGNWNEDSINLLVIDTTNPTINSPLDITYVLGEISNNITWEVFDLNPYQYQLVIDGIEQGLFTWDGENLLLNIDNLSLGTHTITLVVVDTEGNWIQDEVIVTVIPEIDESIPGYSFNIIILSSIVSLILIMKKRRTQ